MKKGITSYFGINYDWKERVKDIKNAGFDCCLTSADARFNSENGTIEEQAEYFNQLGLGVDSLHASYSNETLRYFWDDGKYGEVLLENLKKELSLARQYSFKALVVHIQGEPSEIGLQRMRELVEYAENINQVIALENLENPLILDFVFENIDSEYLKFCYDSGHENWSKIQRNVLVKYLDKLVCLHLHDNNGLVDSHTLNKYGSIDWRQIAKILAQKQDIENIVLSYELLLRFKQNETAKEVLDECFKQACELEKMILEFKNI